MNFTDPRFAMGRFRHVPGKRQSTTFTASRTQDPSRHTRDPAVSMIPNQVNVSKRHPDQARQARHMSQPYQIPDPSHMLGHSGVPGQVTSLDLQANQTPEDAPPQAELCQHCKNGTPLPPPCDWSHRLFRYPFPPYDPSWYNADHPVGSPSQSQPQPQNGPRHDRVRTSRGKGRGKAHNTIAFPDSPEEQKRTYETNQAFQRRLAQECRENNRQAPLPVDWEFPHDNSGMLTEEFGRQTAEKIISRFSTKDDLVTYLQEEYDNSVLETLLARDWNAEGSSYWQGFYERLRELVIAKLEVTFY